MSEYFGFSVQNIFGANACLVARLVQPVPSRLAQLEHGRLGFAARRGTSMRKLSWPATIGELHRAELEATRIENLLSRQELLQLLD